MIEDTEESYRKELRIIDLPKANRFALLTVLAAAVIFGIPYYSIWSEQFTPVHIKETFRYLTTRYTYLLALIPLVLMAAGIVFHELIHGLTWSLFTRNGHRSIKYGVLWKYATPYCHCKEPLEVRHYVLGALMPAIVLGILPSVAAVVTGCFYLLVWGIFFIMAAAGDFMVVHLLRNEEKSARVLDHPSEAGCYIYRKIPGQRPR